jgi:hypothetical protein
MSEVKVNKISPRSGTTVTLGDSGDTFTIPSGATINNQGTATNFGATGSASWNTTVKTGDFTAVAGEGYFVDTTSGEITCNITSRNSAGAVVAIKDYANTFDTNKVTLIQNGSDKIGGSALNADLTTEGIAVTLIFIDSTQGWLVTDDGLQSSVSQGTFIQATGGTTVDCGSFRTHIFTGPGTFAVSALGCTGVNDKVEYLVVAGGAGGNSDWSGGSGAGGWRSFTALPGAHPLNGPAALPVSVTSYPVTVGSGGTAGPGPNGLASAGNTSTFSTISSAGGGRAGQEFTGCGGVAGGSGGGNYYAEQTEGAGNTPPVSPAQGNPGGGTGSSPGADGYGSGGGAGAPGTKGVHPSGNYGANGGVGAYIPATFFGPVSPTYGTPGPAAGRYFSGGAGSMATAGGQTCGGAGGGGRGGYGTNCGCGTATAGTVNTGGGGGSGGGNEASNPGKAGGSGIVVIRYQFQQ